MFVTVCLSSAPCAAAAPRRPHGHSRRRSEGAQSAQSRRGHRGRAAKPAKPARADRPRPRQGLEDAKVVTRTEPARSCFGYDIEDVDGFLAKVSTSCTACHCLARLAAHGDAGSDSDIPSARQASPESPANIPMVLASACTLYQTREGGWQDEVGGGRVALVALAALQVVTIVHSVVCRRSRCRWGWW